jgi:hypothetical protein
MSQFIVSEICEIPFSIKNGIKCLEKEHINDFWVIHPHYATKNGCYIFAIRNRGLTPYYVGKSSTRFQLESFTTDKILKYQRVLLSNTHGTPVMIFISQSNSRTRVSDKKLTQLESYLIQSAASANQKLVNIHGKSKPSWSIRGITERTKGGPRKTEKAFLGMLKINR